MLVIQQHRQVAINYEYLNLSINYLIEVIKMGYDNLFKPYLRDTETLERTFGPQRRASAIGYIIGVACSIGGYLAGRWLWDSDALLKFFTNSTSTIM